MTDDCVDEMDWTGLDWTAKVMQVKITTRVEMKDKDSVIYQ